MLREVLKVLQEAGKEATENPISIVRYVQTKAEDWAVGLWYSLVNLPTAFWFYFMVILLCFYVYQRLIEVEPEPDNPWIKASNEHKVEFQKKELEKKEEKEKKKEHKEEIEKRWEQQVKQRMHRKTLSEVELRTIEAAAAQPVMPHEVHEVTQSKNNKKEEEDSNLYRLSRVTIPRIEEEILPEEETSTLQRKKETSRPEVIITTQNPQNKKKNTTTIISNSNGNVQATGGNKKSKRGKKKSKSK